MTRLNTIFILLWILGYAMPIFFLPEKVKTTYFGFYVLFMCLFYTIETFWSRQLSGQLILKIVSKRRLVYSFIWLIISVSLIIWSVNYAIRNARNDIEATAIIIGFCSLLVITPLIFLASNPEFRVKGVLYRDKLLLWEKIAAYKWTIDLSVNI